MQAEVNWTWVGRILREAKYLAADFRDENFSSVESIQGGNFYQRLVTDGSRQRGGKVLLDEEGIEVLIEKERQLGRLYTQPEMNRFIVEWENLRLNNPDYPRKYDDLDWWDRQQLRSQLLKQRVSQSHRMRREQGESCHR